jgi:hypothetical protein
MSFPGGGPGFRGQAAAPRGGPGVRGPAAASDGGRAAWRALDEEIGPGHYHFAAQAPRLPMRFRRAALMRGFETEMGALGVGAVTLVVHARPTGGTPPVADAELPHFDVDLDGSVRQRQA